MSFGKTMEILAQVANVVVAFVQSEWFVGAHDTKTTGMTGRDSGNLYIMSNQAKGVNFNWMAERGPASDRLYSYASSGNSFKSTVEAMKGLGDGYYVQIVFQPVGTLGGRGYSVIGELSLAAVLGLMFMHLWEHRKTVFGMPMSYLKVETPLDETAIAPKFARIHNHQQHSSMSLSPFSIFFYL